MFLFTVGTKHVGEDEPVGTCSTKALYRYNIDFNAYCPHQSWRKLWTLDLPSTLKFSFGWRWFEALNTWVDLHHIFLHIDPTSVLFHRRLLTISFCGCPMRDHLAEHSLNIFPPQLANHLNTWFWSTNKDSICTTTRICRYFWKARKTCMFQQHPYHPQQIHLKAILSMLEWNMANHLA